MTDESGVRGGSEVVFRSFGETGTSFHSFVIKKDAGGEGCRICREKRSSGLCE